MGVPYRTRRAGVRQNAAAIIPSYLAILVEALDGVCAHLHLRVQPNREDDDHREVQRVREHDSRGRPVDSGNLYVW